MTNLELYHYGIKGMKWGVRRYQHKNGTLTKEGRDRYIPKSGDDFKLSKKVRLYRWSNNGNEAVDSRRKYAFATGGDMERYSELLDNRTAKLIEMTPVKNLKVAGYKESAKAILKAYGDKNVSDIDKYTTDSDIKTELRKRFDYKDHRDEGTLGKVFDLAVDNIPSHTKTHGEKVIDDLLKKKYDAMVDVYDKTIQYGDVPIILLNPSKSIKSHNTHNYDDYLRDDFWK